MTRFVRISLVLVVVLFVTANVVGFLRGTLDLTMTTAVVALSLSFFYAYRLQLPDRASRSVFFLGVAYTAAISIWSLVESLS